MAGKPTLADVNLAALKPLPYLFLAPALKK